MFNFWDSCTEPLTEPVDSWAQNDPQKRIKIEFVTSLVKSKLEIGGLRRGLRDMIISKYKASPFTGIENHFNIYIRSFSILIWNHGPLKHQIFEGRSIIQAFKNRGALALFQKKSLGHFNLGLVNQFWCYWHDFFFIVNLESALFTLYENKNSRSPYGALWDIEI